MKKRIFHNNISAVIFLLTGVLLMAGCGGTKVYDLQKTVVYNGAMYNLSDVKTAAGHIEGTVGPDQRTINLKNVDKNQFEDYLEEHGKIFVKMYYAFDDEQLVYRANNVDRWRDFAEMKKDFGKAGEKIAELMKDKKSTQVELR